MKNKVWFLTIIYSIFSLILITFSFVKITLSKSRINDQDIKLLYGPDLSFRNKEELDRGLIVVHTSEGNYLSWRLFTSEDEIYGFSNKNISFDIYRNSKKIATEKYSTNYVDRDGKITDKYSVAPKNGEKSLEITPLKSGSNYFDIKLDKPDSLKLKDGNTYEYRVGDISCGDLDGDGRYELVVKWDCNPKDNSESGFTGNVLLDAYDMEEKVKLWRIDLGENIRSGAHYTQFLVYDFNMDGKSEIITKTAPGSKDGLGNFVTEASKISEIKNSKNNFVSYVNKDGHIISGDEYLTVFKGDSGEAIDTIYFPVKRVSNDVWGDNYGNRSERYIASVAYLDGKKPFAVYWRGYYMGQNGKQRLGVAGIEVKDNKLNVKYIFDTEKNQPGYKTGNEIYVGQGNHNITVADVDNDGKDEFISSELCFEIDDNDKLNPKWFNKKGHGDALHIGNYDPHNDSYEYFTVHENYPFGMSLLNSLNGNEYLRVPFSRDTGRGIMGNFGMGGLYQISSSAGTYLIYNDQEFKEIDTNINSNFRIFWDGDLYDEFLNGTVISKWNGEKIMPIFEASDCISINGSKENPALQADLFGDWREEIIYPTENNEAIRIFTTDIKTEYKMKTLMNDSMYREGVIQEQSAYNQPPHISMYFSKSLFEKRKLDEIQKYLLVMAITFFIILIYLFLTIWKSKKQFSNK